MNNKEFLAEINANPRVLTREEIQRCLEGADVFWLYRNGTGEPHSDFPHVVLHSGLHSDGFVNAGEALKNNSGFRKAIARSLLMARPNDWDEIFTDVVGADTSSTLLAKDVAAFSVAEHIRMVKLDAGAGQMWHPDNGPLLKDHLILHIEELITTSVSALEVRKGIRQRWASTQIYFARYLLTMIDRSDPNNRVAKVEDSEVLSLIQLNIRNFPPENCPYCKVGSKVLKAKEGDNWALLTGKK